MHKMLWPGESVYEFAANGGSLLELFSPDTILSAVYIWIQPDVEYAHFLGTLIVITR